MTWLLIAILSYLIGSIPNGYLVARSQGVDIRQLGSRNIGATNVLRVMGKKWGYLVFLCDTLKGFLAVKLGLLLATQALLSPVLGGVIAAITCILGHNYTIWLGFKGGKGMATSGGVVLALFPVSRCLLRGDCLDRGVLRQQVRIARFDCRGDRSTMCGVSVCRQNGRRVLDVVHFYGTHCRIGSLASSGKYRAPEERHGVSIREEMKWIPSQLSAPVAGARPWP